MERYLRLQAVGSSFLLFSIGFNWGRVGVFEPSTDKVVSLVVGGIGVVALLAAFIMRRNED